MLPTWLRVTQPCICFDTHVGSSGEGACDTECPGNCHEETVDVPVSQTQEQIVEVLPWKRIPERVAKDVDAATQVMDITETVKDTLDVHSPVRNRSG